MNLAKFIALLLCGCASLFSLAGCGGDNNDPPAPPAQTLSSIAVSTSPGSVDTGTTHQFSATARDQAGNVMTGVTFTWSSSSTNVATIDAAGLANAVAAGTTSITASAQGVTSGAVALTVVQATAVTGTAATGAAIANATITLKDAQGTIRTATSGADGAFSIRTTGLAAPYLLQVQPATGPALYSVSAEAGANAVINLTPLTDLIVRSWYGVQGVAVDAAFAAPASNPPPSAGEVELLSRVVLQVVKLWLDDAGIDTATFSPISTPFQANSTGVDHVLDLTTVDAVAGEITITDGPTTQVTDVSYDTTNGAIHVVTTTTGASGSSSSSSGTVVPVSSEEQAALEAINDALEAFAAVIGTRGAALTAADVAPYVSNSLLSEGLDKDQFCARIATDFRGRTAAFETNRIARLDATNGTADVEFDVTLTEGAQSSTETVRLGFRREGSSWLLDGDQRIASISLHAEMRTNQGAFAADSGPSINVDVQPLQGAVTAVSIDGGPWANASLQQGATVAEEVEPVPGNPQTILFDHYYINSGPLSGLIPAGTDFTFTLPRSSGSPVTYTLETNAFTTEPISITNLTGSTLADANLGAPLNVVWTLPTTYPVVRVDLMALTFTGDQSDPATLQCEVDGPILATTATSATITVPAECQGQPVAAVNLNLSVTGANGERNQVIYSFQ